MLFNIKLLTSIFVASLVGSTVARPPLVDAHPGTLDMTANLAKRAGPSGQLLAPVGDQFIYTEVGWPGAGFKFSYKPVYQRSRDSACANHRQTCWAATTWLEVSLVSSTDASRIYKLVDYLHASLDNPAANIDAWLGVPVEAVCGDYRVKVIEHQRYFDQWISFQSAAPLVHMQCVRYAGPV